MITTGLLFQLAVVFVHPPYLTALLAHGGYEPHDLSLSHVFARYCMSSLVGGLELFFHILGIIIPTD